MTTSTDSHFALPQDLRRKAAPSLIDDDEARFAAIDAAVAAQVAAGAERLAALYRVSASSGREAAERDAEIRSLTARLGVLRRRGAELCLGRMSPADGADVYLGRLGVTDAQGRELLRDWRTPAAAPFFAASRAASHGLLSRRRYRWSGGRVVDFWDELLTDEPGDRHDDAALDAESSFLAALGDSRTTRMRDVLTTLAADQDAIIRDPANGTLVVDGGPGTGKTVVALHRAAYLLYADPRVTAARGGVLFVGPTERFLKYVADVVPDLGEEGTRFATLRDLVSEGAGARPEPDPVIAGLKAGLTAVVEPAIAFYEEPPNEPLTVETDWAEIEITPADWAVAFDAVEPGTPHNEARGVIREALIEVLTERHDDLPAAEFGAALTADHDLRLALNRAWPLLEPTDVVADLWTVPAYLRRCAPWLNDDEVRALQRPSAPQSWTDADLPLLDAARHRLGDKGFEARLRRRTSTVTEQHRVMDEVLDQLVAADDDREGLVQQFAFGGMSALTTDESGLPTGDSDRLAGPFAHVIVDEAQELTEAQWEMLRRRCPAGGFTVVGDRAQARRGFAEPWEERLSRAGLRNIRVARLSLNYRTPRAIMECAAREIVTALPTANIPESLRDNGISVRTIGYDTIGAALTAWLAANSGVAGVIVAPDQELDLPGDPRITRLAPDTTSGLEYDLVAVCSPAGYGQGLSGAVSRYIAMTRATREMMIVR
ncbi:AAA family ATPase [Gordonia iterans]|uniref:AAA family ATPase n=1 Tax=Gordonia iterans TaxID=1004901 RepID=A0A2S0KFB3_9ACTN|nr:RNA polymerase recycling motor ATPase HelR [Gordonia iterans]AVM00346.1 AAA family ATPase [Gordonia iterans]